MPVASSLAAEIKSKYSVDAELIPSKGGCFEVVADGKLIFSKNAEKRFPEHDEVLTQLDAMQ